MYFCMTKSTKSHLSRSLLEISLSVPALPKREQYTPSCANISSEPSDLRQSREYRLKCQGVCSTLLCAMPIRQGFMPFPLSAHRLRTRPPLLYMRAWNKRIRESARLLRVMCSHAWYRESHGERQNFVFCLTRRPHSLATQYSLRLSRVCGRSLKEESLPLFVLFVLFGQAKSTFTYSYF